MLTLTVVEDQKIMSELEGFTDIGVVLRPINVPLRATVELSVSKYRAMIYDLQLELETVRPKLQQWIEKHMNKSEEGGDPFPADYKFPAEALALARRIQDIETDMRIVKVGHIIPAWIKAAVKTVIGVKVGDRPATPDEFAVCNYPNLLAEIGEKILEIAYMTVEERANFQSPTTSGAVDGGQKHSTSATTASKSNGNGLEIVASIFEKV